MTEMAQAARSCKAVLGVRKLSKTAFVRLRGIGRCFRLHGWSILVAITLSLSLTFISLRDFLLGSGYYEYADQHWPPLGSIYPTGYFSPSPLTSNGFLYPLQFSRDFITFPIGLFHVISLNSLAQEKLFFIYSFVLFLLLAYVFAALIVHYALKTLRTKLSVWKTELARVLIVLSLFTNLYFIYMTVDGGTVTGCLIGIFIGISALLLLAEDDFLTALACSVVLSSLGFLLDPSNAFTVLVTLGLAVFLRSIVRKEGLPAFFTHLGQLLLASVPTALFLVYFFYPTLGHGFAVALDYPVRPFSLSGIQEFASYTTLPNVLRLTGYAWTTVTFTPPSILWYSGSYSQLPGLQSPTTILIAPGSLTQVWLLALFAPFVLACVSLMIRRLRPLTAPFGVILLVCVLLTQWPWIPPAAALVSWVAALPLIGPLVGEALYFPYLFMLGESIAILVLSGCLIVSLITDELRVADRIVPRCRPYRGPREGQGTVGIGGSRHPYGRPRSIRGRARYVAVAVVAILLVLPGWQALDGSYFPSRAWSPYVTGNGVPNAGPFEPLNAPPGVDALLSYFYHLSGAFNIYWPTWGANATDFGRGAFFFDSEDSPKPLSALPALPYLVAKGLTGALAAYLQSQNVAYVVVQNVSTLALQQEYGLSSYGSLLGFLRSIPGLSPEPSLSNANLTVLQVSQPWGSTYSSNELLAYAGGSSDYAPVYAIDRDLNQTPAVVDGAPASTTLAVNNLSGGESILSPGGIYNLTGTGSVGSQPLNLPLSDYPTTPAGKYSNFTKLTEEINRTFDQRPAAIISIGNWSLVDWGPSNVSVTVRSGSLIWTALGQTTVTLTYGSLLTSGPGGVRILTPGFGSIATSLNFSYSTSSNFGGSLSSYVRDETTNSSIAQVPLSSLLTDAQEETSVSFGAPTLPWTTFVQSCFQASFSSGSIAVNMVNYSWNEPRLSAAVHVDYNEDSLGPWTLTNWSSPVPMFYTYEGGTLDVNSPSGAGTFSLNYGPSLTSGYGGASNPRPGSQSVIMTMQASYRTSPNFSAQVFNLASFDQVSSSPTAGAIGSNGPALPPSAPLRTVRYSTTLPASTRNFTIRLQAIGFRGSFELANVTFTWAFLPVQNSTPYGVALPIPANETISWPLRFGSSFAEISGPPPLQGSLVGTTQRNATFRWYRFPGPFIALTSEDQLGAVALFVKNPSPTPIATVYTGPTSVDLVLVAGGTRYLPYGTMDGDALFLYNGTESFSIEHSAVIYIELYYFAFIAYLAMLYPALLYLRRQKRLPWGKDPDGGSPSRKLRQPVETDDSQAYPTRP